MKKRAKFFKEFQQFGTALMLPVSVLPVAGFMMGIGFLLKNETLLQICTFLNGEFFRAAAAMLQSISGIIFSNLALLFAMGVAAGMTEDSGTSAFSGALGLLMMHSTISLVMRITPETVAENGYMFTNVLGINSLQMGPFGGIIIGYIVSLVYRRFHQVKLPDMLNLFSGKRCVPLIVSAVSIALGVFFSFAWPPVQHLQIGRAHV